MAIPIYMIVAILVLHFGNVYLARRVKRLAAELEAKEEVKEMINRLLLDPEGVLLIKKGRASTEAIDDVVESIDDLMMLAGRSCKIRIED